jgi:hypothetical protein
MLKSILIGTLLTIVTVGIHAAGTTWWMAKLQNKWAAMKQALGSWSQLSLLCQTAMLLLLLHISEIVVWALTYLTLPTLGEVDTLEEATYFSAVTFASLGYGDIVITDSWRLLSAIQAVNGLLIFGWSTALLYSVYQGIWSLETFRGPHRDD